MELAIVAGAMLDTRPTLTEWISHDDAEVFLSCIEIFRPYPFATAAFRCSNNHAVIKVQPIRRLRFYRPPDEAGIRRNELDR